MNDSDDEIADSLTSLSEELVGTSGEVSGWGDPLSLFIRVAFVLEMQSPSLSLTWDVWNNCPSRTQLDFQDSQHIQVLIVPVLSSFAGHPSPPPGSSPSPQSLLGLLFQAPMVSYTNLYVQHH